MHSDTIKIHCTDNDKWVEAQVVNSSDVWIIAVIQPGNIKITLKKTKPSLYVGQMHGYEFVYKVQNK